MTIDETIKAERTQRQDVGSTAIQAIREAMEATGINASGSTSKSLEYKQDAFSLVVFAEGRHAPIATLQHGSRPTPKGGGGFYPEILQWVKDKGLDVQPTPSETLEKAQARAAHAIYHKIWEEGTQRHLHPRSDIYTPALDKAVEDFTAQVAGAVVDIILG